MDVKINAPTIHNRFDIYKNGKQIAFAENIILDTMWTQLCAGGYPFVNIQYGIGTGTLEKTRTTLFTYLGSKAATLVTRVYANPTSSLRQSIEIGLTEHNGSVLTEVGLSNTTGNSGLRTHAMLRDMNGNPVSITKTSVDILTIYGTLYATIDNSHAVLKMIKPKFNGIIKMIMGEGGITTTVIAGQSGVSNLQPVSLLSSSLGTSSTAGTWTADVANKRRSLATPRFGINDANGHIKEFVFGSIARLTLSATGIFTGLDIVGASVGSGDGEITTMVLPSANIDPLTVVVKVDGGVSSPILTASKDSGYRVATPEIIGTELYALALSYTGTVLAIGTGSTPYFYSYDLIDGQWIVRPNPVSLPTSYAGGLALSQDGYILVVAMSGSSESFVYDWVGGAWVKRAATIPTTKSHLWITPTGNTVSIGATVWDFVTPNWVQRSAVPAGPTANIRSSRLSDNGLVFVEGDMSFPYINAYDWSGSIWTKRPNPADMPLGCSMLELSDDGSVCAVSFDSSPYIKVYDWSGTAWISRVTPTEIVRGRCGLSGDGNILAMLGYTSPYLAFYDWSGSIWTKRQALPTGAVDGSIVGLSRGGQIAAINSTASPYITTYIITSRMTTATFTTPPGLIIGESVGTGDGSDVTWNLDHTPIAGSLVAKLDGVTTTDYTLVGSEMTFNTAPGVGVLITADYRYPVSITADYTVDGIHKTSTRVIDLTFTIQFGEPT